MPTCENCNNTWSWKQTMKKMMILNPAMSCPYCDKKQYQTKKSRMKTSLTTMIIFIPLFIRIIFDVQGELLLILFPVLGLIVILLMPYLLEIKSEEEYIDFTK